MSLFSRLFGTKEIGEPSQYAEEKRKVYEELEIVLSCEYTQLQDVQEDLKKLQAVTTACESILKSSHTGEKLSALYDELRAHCELCEVHGAEVDLLLKRGTELSAEILKYAELAKQLGDRYKLSPDWEGKKPKMIALGQALNEKRAQYLSDEQDMEVRTMKLYSEREKLSELLVEVRAKS